MPTSSPRYLDTRAAAEYLGVSYSKLSHARSDGKGPPYSRWPGSTVVRYDVRDLDAWMDRLKALGVDGMRRGKRRRGPPSKAEVVARRLRQDGPAAGRTSRAPGTPEAKG